MIVSSACSCCVHLGVDIGCKEVTFFDRCVCHSFLQSLHHGCTFIRELHHLPPHLVVVRQHQIKVRRGDDIPVLVASFLAEDVFAEHQIQITKEMLWL